MANDIRLYEQQYLAQQRALQLAQARAGMVGGAQRISGYGDIPWTSTTSTVGPMGHRYSTQGTGVVRQRGTTLTVAPPRSKKRRSFMGFGGGTYGVPTADAPTTVTGGTSTMTSLLTPGALLNNVGAAQAGALAAPVTGPDGTQTSTYWYLSPAQQTALATVLTSGVSGSPATVTSATTSTTYMSDAVTIDDAPNTTAPISATSWIASETAKGNSVVLVPAGVSIPTAYIPTPVASVWGATAVPAASLLPTTVGPMTQDVLVGVPSVLGQQLAAATGGLVIATPTVATSIVSSMTMPVATSSSSMIVMAAAAAGAGLLAYMLIKATKPGMSK